MCSYKGYAICKRESGSGVHPFSISFDNKWEAGCCLDCIQQLIIKTHLLRQSFSWPEFECIRQHWSLYLFECCFYYCVVLEIHSEYEKEWETLLSALSRTITSSFQSREVMLLIVTKMSFFESAALPDLLKMSQLACKYSKSQEPLFPKPITVSAWQQCTYLSQHPKHQATQKQRNDQGHHKSCNAHTTYQIFLIKHKTLL